MAINPRSNLQAVIGRNDPCPCGSGKKYKKCCLESDAAAKMTMPPITWQETGARPATMPDTDSDIHPYAIVKMGGNPFPKVWSQLSKREAAALKAKAPIHKAARLETAEIVGRLERLGIDGHQAAFVALTDGRISAWSIGNVWIDNLSAPPRKGDEDFICLAACELWKRYCPERPSMEMVDDWVTEGYDLSQARKETEAAEVWLRAWDHVRPRIEPHMTSFEDADEVFEVTQLFRPWIQDVAMSLGNAAIRDPKYADIGMRVIGEVLGQFVNEDLDTVLNFRCELGKLLFQAGRCEEGEAALATIIREHPDRSCGYAYLSDELGYAKHAEPDEARAIALLEQALAYPVVDAADWDIEQRLEDMREVAKHPPQDGPTA